MKRKLLCALVAAALLPGMAVHAAQAGASVAAGVQDTQAQDDTAPPPPPKKADTAAIELKSVKVTGSLIPRAQIEGPSPTITVTAKDIDKQGFGDVFEALRAQPVSNGSVQDPQFTGGFTPGAKTISLFGMDPSFTLTLLNGRPMTSYPLAYNGGTSITDIANIPVGLIDHIDILTGAQSSIYGSSAISGVVNIVLKDHIEGTHVAFRMGHYSQGGGESQRLQLSSGHSWGNLDVSGGLQFSRETPIFAYQRSYTDSYTDDPTGQSGTPSRVALRESVNPTVYLDPGADACSGFNSTFFGSTRYSYRDGFGYYCGSTENAGLASFANKSNDANGSLFLRYHVNDHTELYADMLYSFSNPTYTGGSPFWNQTFYNQGTGQYELWQRIFSPEEVGNDATFQRVFTHSYNAAFGVSGDIGDSDWTYDAYYNRSASKVVRKTHDFLAENGVDQYYLGDLLGTDASGYPIYDPDASRLYQPVNAALYDAWVGLNRAVSSSWTQNETVTANTTDLFDMPAGPVGFAVIGQASNETFNNRSSSPLGDIGYFRGEGGSTVASGSRKQYAVGMEMRVPLLQSLTADASARYDKYSYAGGGNGKATYKLGLEYRPMDNLLIRGSYATAFRAPDMFSLFSVRSSGYTTTTDYYKCRSAGFDSTNYDECPESGISPLSVHSGNTGLKDITAKSLTYGFVWSTEDNRLSWSVDYNAIRVSNEVAILGDDEILSQEANCRLGVSDNGQTAYDINSPTCQEVLGEVTRAPMTDLANPGGVTQIATYPINVSSEYQTGLQSKLNYLLDVGRFGTFAFGVDYYTAFKHEYQEKAGDPTYELLSDANSNEFRSRVTGDVTWNVGNWSTTVFGIRNGKTWNQAGTDKNIGPWVTFNASVRYRVNPQTSISLVANNIADKRPPVDVTNGGWPYYDTGDYNALGRAVYLEANWDFGI